MRWVVDLLYLIAAVLASPVWLVRLIRTGKIHTDWRGRFGRTLITKDDDRQRIMIHAVSVGEVNAIRLLVDRLTALPAGPRVIIATTTNTGFVRASAMFAPAHDVVRYPLDFSWAVSRLLRSVQPDVVALVELEVWPNFTAQCARRGIPVCVINGRLTERSARRYHRIGALVRPSFARLRFAAVQDDVYADRFRALGTGDVRVTGTMKWDTADITDDVHGAAELVGAMGIDTARPLIVAGSTAPGEHELLVQAAPPEAQLLCAPRKPEWFDDAAEALPGCARRSRGDRGSSTGRFLLDSIGELRMAYALADVVVIGRTFVPLGGSDMIEPIALGKATIIGPHVTNFLQTVDALREGDGVLQVSESELPTALASLLADPARRARLARLGRGIITTHQGATDRHVKMIESLLDRSAE